MALSRAFRDTDPFFSSALSMRDPFETMFNLPITGATTRGDLWTPEMAAVGPMMKLDVKESDKNYDVVADLPGVNKEDIKVDFDQNMLRISAERKEVKKQEGDRWHLSERRWGSVNRSLRLPQDATSEGISAKYQDGVLHITVPKTEKSQSRRAITVD